MARKLTLARVVRVAKGLNRPFPAVRVPKKRSSAEDRAPRACPARTKFLLNAPPSLALPINLDCLRHFAQPHTVSAVSAILPAVYSTPGIRWILSFSSIFFLSFTMSIIVCKDWRVMEASG